jgi:hypothetical protein
MSSGQLTTNWTGAITTTSGDIQWDYLINQMIITLPEVIGAQQAGTDVVSVTPLAMAHRPETEQVVPCNVIVDGVKSVGTATVGTNGIITVTEPGNFNGQNTQGFVNYMITYPLPP